MHAFKIAINAREKFIINEKFQHCINKAVFIAVIVALITAVIAASYGFSLVKTNGKAKVE